MRYLVLLFLGALSLAAAEARRCVFCEIVAGVRENAEIYRDDMVMAFLSIGPRNPGHVLVIPLAHAEDFMTVPLETMHAMTDAALKMAEAMGRTDITMEGFHLQMNTGKAAGQSVFHAHLHIIPRFSGEAPAKTPEDRVPMAELEPVAEKIRNALTKSPMAVPRVPLVLPTLGEVVPLGQIRMICDYYGLSDLWEKIERDPPIRSFASDGCTGWFDDWKGVSLYEAGFLHDLKYWAGYPGEKVARLVADAELMIAVARLLGTTGMAETMFHGVRVGGDENFNASFSWGFGRKPLESNP